MQEYRVTVEPNVLAWGVKRGSYNTKRIIWYKPGTTIRHRLDGPAETWSVGIEIWFKNGLRHREDGPAYRDFKRGASSWWLNGLRHREDGPAIINCEAWPEDNMHENNSGVIPVEWGDPNKLWFLEGKQYTEKEFKAKLAGCDGEVIVVKGKKYKLTFVEDE